MHPIFHKIWKPQKIAAQNYCKFHLSLQNEVLGLTGSSCENQHSWKYVATYSNGSMWQLIQITLVHHIIHITFPLLYVNI